MPALNDRHIAELEKLIFSEREPERFNRIAAQCIKSFYEQTNELVDYKLLFWANQKAHSFIDDEVDYHPISRVVVGHCTSDIIGRVPSEPQTIDSVSGIKVKSLMRNRLDDTSGLVVMSDNSELFHGGEEGYFVPDSLDKILSAQRHHILRSRIGDS